MKAVGSDWGEREWESGREGEWMKGTLDYSTKIYVEGCG